MAKLEMCSNFLCQARHDCYRYMAEPEPNGLQRWFLTGVPKEIAMCGEFWGERWTNTDAQERDQYFTIWWGLAWRKPT